MKHFLKYVIVLCVLLTSNAATQTWVSLNGPQIASGVKDISATTDGGTVFVADNSFVLKSTNGGTPWRPTEQVYSSPLLILVKPNNASIVLAAKNGELRYNDAGGGGSGWTNISNLQDLTPLRLVADVNNNTVMLLGRTYVSGNSAIWRSDNSGASWSKVDGFIQQTDIHDFACYPNSTSGWGSGIVWAGGSDPDGTPNGANNASTASTSGLWTSTDYGATWSADRLGNRNIRSVALVPKTYPTDYVRLVAEKVSGGNDAVLRNTSLSGDDWTSVFSGAADVYMMRLKISNNNLFLATSSGVYRSTDEGQNWSQKNSGLGSDTDVLTIAPTSSGDIVFAGTANSLYKSSDNGDTWIDVGKMKVSSVEVNGQSVWAVSTENSFASYSTNKGITWTNKYIQSPSAAFSSQQVYRSPHSGSIFIVGALNNVAKVYRSTNAGESYSSATIPALNSGSNFYGIRAKLTSPDDNLYIAGGATLYGTGTLKNVFNSADDGVEWSATSYTLGSGFVINYFYVTSENRFALLANGEVQKTTNSGENWTTSLANSGTGYSLSIQPNNTSSLYVARSGGIWRSSNAGGSWTQIKNDNAKRVVFNLPYPDGSIFALTENSGSHVLSSTDAGANWSDITGDLSQAINDIHVPANAGYVLAATNRGVYNLDIPPAKPTGIEGSISDGHPRIDWDANAETDLHSSTPYSVYRQWRHVPEIPPYPFPEEFVGSTTNTYFVDDEFSEGEPCEECKIVYWVVVTDAGSNQSEASEEIGFNVKEDPVWKVMQPESDKPLTFSLSSNYPNPFNPTTIIKYGVPVDGRVTIKVYDVLGRAVMTLVDGEIQAGYHEVKMDASQLSSGVYFYRMQAQAFVSSKKMLVVK